MAETKATAIGSKEWWTFNADKLIDTALGVLKYKLEGGITEPNGASNTSNTTSSFGGSLTNMLPWILGGVAVIGIGIILVRR
jgi:hypothetical protein